MIEDLPGCCSWNIAIALCLVMALVLIDFCSFSSLSMWLLVFHCCVVQCFIRLSNCLKIGCPKVFFPKLRAIKKHKWLVKKLNKVVLFYNWFLLDSIFHNPHIDLNEFNYCYVNNLLNMLSKENATAFILGDFDYSIRLTSSH